MLPATAVVAVAIVGSAQLSPAQHPPGKIGAPAGVQSPSATATSGHGRVFQLRVVSAASGKPVKNAQVRVWIGLRDERKTTDDLGRLDIIHSTGAADRCISVDVWGDGYAMQRHSWGEGQGKPVPDGETIRLQPGESLGGMVRDEQGRPISGAVVYLWSHNYKRRDPHELLFDLRAVTGHDGRWTTSGAPETTGELLGFHLVHPDYLSSRDYTEKETIPRIADLRAGKAVSVMKKGVPIEGRVLDADGRPVPGARVISNSYQQALYEEDFIVTTGADGRFRTGQVKAGEWFLVAMAKGHGPGEARIKVGNRGAPGRDPPGPAADLQGPRGRPRGQADRGSLRQHRHLAGQPLPGRLPLQRRRRASPLGRRAAG